ncbi:UDP-glucose 4-epimerase [subsurface metagenome]
MKVLITGGAGFIGSHLAEELLQQGMEVYVIDDLSTGAIQNIQHLKENDRFHYVIDDIRNRSVLGEMIDLCPVVYHLAAAVGVHLILDSPTNTIENNVFGTELVLKLAAKKRKKVLISSTSEVYGKSEKMPCSEADNILIGAPNNIRWSYACSKAIDEFLALAYYKEMRLPVVVARLFNTVGPRQTGRYGMVIPRFIKQALRGERICVYGDGKQSRCFCYVKDTVAALIGLMECKQAAGGVFNVGSTEEVTIAELAQKVKTLTGSSSEIVYVPYDEAYEQGFEDMRRRVPDITRIKELIGFEPSHSLDDALRLTIEFLKENLDEY